MMLFVLDMAAYLITLLGAMGMLAFAAWKSASYGTAGITSVLLLVPFACWGTAWVHWHAYERSKAMVVHIIPILARFASQSATSFSEFVMEGSELVHALTVQATAYFAQSISFVLFGPTPLLAYAHSRLQVLPRAVRSS